jgi:hypothetical protein
MTASAFIEEMSLWLDGRHPLKTRRAAIEKLSRLFRRYYGMRICLSDLFLKLLDNERLSYNNYRIFYRYAFEFISERDMVGVAFDMNVQPLSKTHPLRKSALLTAFAAHYPIEGPIKKWPANVLVALATKGELDPEHFFKNCGLMVHSPQVIQVIIAFLDFLVSQAGHPDLCYGGTSVNVVREQDRLLAWQESRLALRAESRNHAQGPGYFDKFSAYLSSGIDPRDALLICLLVLDGLLIEDAIKLTQQRLDDQIGSGHLHRLTLRYADAYRKRYGAARPRECIFGQLNRSAIIIITQRMLKGVGFDTAMGGLTDFRASILEAVRSSPLA